MYVYCEVYKAHISIYNKRMLWGKEHGLCAKPGYFHFPYNIPAKIELNCEKEEERNRTRKRALIEIECAHFENPLLYQF